MCVQGKLKEVTLARMSELVIKDDRLPVLLDRCVIVRRQLSSVVPYEITTCVKVKECREELSSSP